MLNKFNKPSGLWTLLSFTVHGRIAESRETVFLARSKSKSKADSQINFRSFCLQGLSVLFGDW